MSIFQKLNDDLKVAMRAKDVVARDVVRALITAVKNDAIAQKTDAVQMSDEAVLSILKRAKKQREEAAKTYMQGGREELAQNELTQIKIIEKYLPAQMSKEEITQIVDSVIAGGAQGMGAVMGGAMSQIGSRADGGTVREIVQSKLS